MRKMLMAAAGAAALIALPSVAVSTAALAQDGAAGGAAAGIATGAVTGAVVGGPVGAAVGAAAGGVVGAGAGAAADSANTRERVYVVPAEPAPEVTQRTCVHDSAGTRCTETVR
ncbi:hypothetical protein [Methyloraptor flagellatus]|uniref:Glycine zipper domain-containing protein n=1 Tax=Methyloraptor flagellatus TaxID=3162530 RepID=A0AAU7X7I0_9HYPH